MSRREAVAHAVRPRLACALALLCGCTSTPEETGAGGAGPTEKCGVGPALVYFGDCPEPYPEPQCPAAPPAEGYVALVSPYNCHYVEGEPGCDPRLLQAHCPQRGDHQPALGWRGKFSQEPGAPPAYDVNLSVDHNATGDFDVYWEATELDPDTEDPVGELMTGQGSLRGPCCELTFDIPFPSYDHVVRVLVQTDWEP